MSEQREEAGARVDLYWLPLGAGDRTHLVALSGTAYEWSVARRGARPRQRLFHSALLVQVDGATWAIEMGPVWRTTGVDRGVVGEGVVGTPWLGRSRLFRYEVRCWLNGTIPDLAEAVGSPQQLSTDPLRARLVLELVGSFPCRTWGRDEQHLGEMWNSNSLVSWLLVRSGHDLTDIRPPDGGRAPGWEAGVAAARIRRLATPAG